MHQELISIILPTYNGNPIYLKEVITSIFAQTYKYWELIIINDASTNDIEEEILTLIDHYRKEKYDSIPQIIYIKNQKNLWLTKTLNKALTFAHWEYIARIDDDDLWLMSDKLEKQLKYMQQHQKVAVCGTRSEHVFFETSKNFTRETPLSDAEIRKVILYNCPFHHSSVLIRKKYLDQLWWYNPKYNGIEDRELWMRLGTLYQLVNLPDVAAVYRHIDWSITSNQVSFLKRLRINFRIFLLSLKYKKYYPNFIKACCYRLFCCLPLFLQSWLIDLVKNNAFLRKLV